MRLTFHIIALILVLSSALPTATAVASSEASGFVPDGPVVATLGDEHDSSEAGADLATPVLWTIVGILFGAVALTILYAVKLLAGGFPKNPSWVAPISIERSSTFPDENDDVDSSDGANGHH